MKSVCFLFGFLFTFFLCSDVSAQSFDMRAYSRQRGFKAYQVKSSFPVQSKVNSSAPIGEKQARIAVQKLISVSPALQPLELFQIHGNIGEGKH